MRTPSSVVSQRTASEQLTEQPTTNTTTPSPAPANTTAVSRIDNYFFTLINKGCDEVTNFYNYAVEGLKQDPERIDFSKLTESYRTSLIIELIQQRPNKIDLLLPEIKKLADANKFEVVKAIIDKLEPSGEEKILMLDLSRESFLALFKETKIRIVPHRYLKTLNLTLDEQFSLLMSLAISASRSVHLHVGFFDIDSAKRFEVFLKSVSLSLDFSENSISNLASAAFRIGNLAYYSLEKKEYLQVLAILLSTLKKYPSNFTQKEIVKTLMVHPHPPEYRFEVAKIFASLCPIQFAEIFDFSSFNQDQRIELFNEALEKEAAATLSQYKRYQINDEKKKIVIEEASDIAPLELLRHQENFPMDDQLRRNILITAATNTPGKTVEFFNAAWLSQESDRADIAEIVAGLAGEAIGTHIQKFKLSELKNFKVGEKAVEQNPGATLRLLPNYGLSQPHFNTIRERALTLLKQ